MKKQRVTKFTVKEKKLVLVVAMSGNTLLYIAGPTDVFFLANQFLHELGADYGYDVRVVAATGAKSIPTQTGLDIRCHNSALDFDGPIDTLIVAGNDFRENSYQHLLPFYEWLATRSRNNTRRIASVCGGAFALAKAGILDGRDATTHWALAERLQKSFPEVKVNSNPFYTNSDGHVYTSAGVTTGIDLAISMVEDDYGKEIAIRVARRLVFYLSRPGLQTQFGSLVPEYGHEHIAKKTQTWILNHIDEKLDVNQVAGQLNMSTRNFTRVFTKQTGVPPAKFIEKIRVESARKLLEDTDLSIETVAERCGLGGLVSMRRIFLRHMRTTPSDYRRAFRTSTAVSGRKKRPARASAD